MHQYALGENRGLDGEEVECSPGRTKSFEGRNTTELRERMTISSPVCGLRPRRSRFWRTRKVPKPVIWTFSPSPKCLLIVSKITSTRRAASRFEIPP